MKTCSVIACTWVFNYKLCSYQTPLSFILRRTHFYHCCYIISQIKNIKGYNITFVNILRYYPSLCNWLYILLIMSISSRLALCNDRWVWYKTQITHMWNMLISFHFDRGLIIACFQVHGIIRPWPCKVATEYTISVHCHCTSIILLSVVWHRRDEHWRSICTFTAIFRDIKCGHYYGVIF